MHWGVVEAAASAYERVGLPEGQFHLTQAALYLATCPKSNSALAFFDALDAVETEEAEVPTHLRDANRDKHSFGHGKGYKYPHAFREHWVAQQYLPGTLKGRIFYQPTGQGYEGTIQSEVIRRREEQLDRMLDEAPETLSFSPGDKERDRWIRRVQGSSASRSKLLKVLTESLQITRSDRILLAPLRWNQLFWELFRMVPEGGLTAISDREDYRNLVEFSMESLPESERPLVVNHSLDTLQWLEHPDLLSLTWEHVVLDGILKLGEGLLPQKLQEKLAPNGWITGCLPLPGAGSRISEILKERMEVELYSQVVEAEELFYAKRAPQPRREELEKIPDLELMEWTLFRAKESLSPTSQWLSAWLKDQSGSWFHYVSRNLSQGDAAVVRSLLQQEKLPSSIPWTRVWLIYRLHRRAAVLRET